MPLIAVGANETGQSGFPESGQYLYSRELIHQAIQDLTAVKFRRPGSLSVGASYDTVLLGRATNAWAVGTSADDVSTLSSLGRVVRAMDATADALLSPCNRSRTP